MNRFFTLVLSAGCLVQVGFGQVVSGSDGSDGALNISGGLQSVDLNQAVIGTWNQASTSPGNGVYDPSKWAVVYKYSSVTINSASGLWFQRHRTNAPVVWLVQGDVNIQTNAFLNLNAGIPNAFNSDYTQVTQGHIAGPGGWDGGYPGQLTVPGGAGFGPLDTAGTNAFSNAKIIPLVGGTGSPGQNNSTVRGNGGGGAILIVAGGTVTMNGYVWAYSRSDAGGAMRIVCSTLAGTGYINASNGRVRLEAQTNNFFGGVGGSLSTFTTPNTPQIWPDSTAPTAEIIQVGSQTPPTDPGGKLETPDMNLGAAGPTTVLVRCRNVPTDGTWTIRVRMIPRNVGRQNYQATLVSGNQAESIWSVTAIVPEGGTAFIARASKN